MVVIVNEMKYPVVEAELKSYVKYLNEEMSNKKNFSIVFLKNWQIKEINSEFRNKDYETDVLSFPFEDEDYLGDILINGDIVSKQAREYGHSQKRELYFLVTHAFLHLLGYDHQTEEDEQEMFSKQEALLTAYNITRSNNG